MAMKPRTFRRVVLLGSLGAAIFLVAFAYFVVRPWQNQRQLEAMRDNGIKAYEEGNYPDAVKMLWRYTSNTENLEDPELLLMHARASEKFEATDRGNIAVAVNSYRDYLRRVPGDVEAKLELLPLLNLRGMFVEAKDLAEDLINTHQVSDIEALIEYRYALIGLQRPESEILPVVESLYQHPDSHFAHASNYYAVLIRDGRQDEVLPLIEARKAAHPGRFQEELLQFQFDSTQLDDQALLYELSSIIGLDVETRAWDPDSPTFTMSEAWYINRVYNALSRTDLAISVQARSAASGDDVMSTIWAPRRLYWAERDNELNELRITTSKGEPDADVLGYQYLSAKRSENDERATEIRTELESIVLDARARAWVEYIKAQELLEEDRAVESRVAMQNALDWYPAEPSFRYRAGELSIAQGHFNEAIDHWVFASELVNDRVGADSRVDLLGWSEPMIRIVRAYASRDRLIEAEDYINELERIAMNDEPAISQVFSARAELARKEQLPRDIGREFVEKWQLNRESFDQGVRARISPLSATILAFMDEEDLAREELLLAITSGGLDSNTVAQALQVDSLYELGVADLSGMNFTQIADSSPVAALRAAGQIYDNTGSIEAGLKVFESGLAEAPDDLKFVWERSRVSFLDERAPARAKPLWEQLLEQRPDDLELLYEAIESRAFAERIEDVDALIERATSMTETTGKVIPTRLQLARAKAFVAGDGQQTKSNREEAMGILRGIVAVEPTNTVARNMLGRLLALPQSPGLPESERYTPDFEGAIEQYQLLARQLRGGAAQLYMLESISLAFRGGDTEQAVGLVEEYETRFGAETRAAMVAASWYEDLGEFDRAQRLYEQVISSEYVPGAALSIAEIELRNGNSGAARSILARVSESDSLTSDELLQLASLYVRTGNKPEGELLAESGERYGLSAFDSNLLLAEFASMYDTPEREVEYLQAATQADPSSTLAWKLYIQRLLELEQFEVAQEQYALALTHVEPDVDLQRLGAISQGAPQTAAEMLNLPGMSSDTRLGQAIQQVEAYSSLPEATDTNTRVGMLRSLIEDFPKIDVVQVYSVERLAQLPINPAVLAPLADQALKNNSSNQVIMGVAGEAYLRIGDADSALRVVDLWRSNTLETTVIANAIRARALIQKNLYNEAEQELQGYVDMAFQAPEDRVHQEVLDAYSFVRLQLGEDPTVTAQRLEPLIADHAEIRNRTWLGLGANVVKDPAVGKRWIEAAAAVAGEDDEVALANAWVSLAFTHEQWDLAYADAALGYLQSRLDSADQMPAFVYSIAARAQLIRARGLSDETQVDRAYESAVNYMLAVADLEGQNIGILLDAARFAAEGKRFAQAEEVYKRVLGYNIGSDQLNAVVSNNLAMVLLRAGLTESQRAEVLMYVERATELGSSAPSFWGTRGWIELHYEMLEQAKASFSTAVRLDANGAEGWAGLAIANKLMGPEFADESARAIERLERVRRESGLSDDVIEMLRLYGLGDIASVDVGTP